MGSLHIPDAMVLPCSSGTPCAGRRAYAATPCLALNWASASPATGCLRSLPLSVRLPSVSSGKMAAAAGGSGAVLTNKPAPVMSNCSSLFNNGVYTVGDFMTKKEDLQVVRPTTTIDEALELLVENRISGFPVIDDNWKLVGLVSDYDLLALDSISGGLQSDTNLFPEVDSSWKTFNEIQKLLGKTNGRVIGDLMTPAPLVVRETTNLEDAARLLLETKYRRLPVVDGDGKLVGILTRGSVVRGALQIKREMERRTLS